MCWFGVWCIEIPLHFIVFSVKDPFQMALLLHQWNQLGVEWNSPLNVIDFGYNDPILNRILVIFWSTPSQVKKAEWNRCSCLKNKLFAIVHVNQMTWSYCLKHCYCHTPLAVLQHLWSRSLLVPDIPMMLMSGLHNIRQAAKCWLCSPHNLNIAFECSIS